MALGQMIKKTQEISGSFSSQTAHYYNYNDISLLIDTTRDVYIYPFCWEKLF